MTKREFDSMMKRNIVNRNFLPDKFHGIMLWIPDVEEFITMAFGNGSNSGSFEDDCEDYIYFNQYGIDADTIGDDIMELPETDGGQMDIKSIDIYDGNILKVIPDMLDFVYGQKYMEVSVIKFYIW